MGGGYLMDKPLLGNQEAWPLLKWSAGILATIAISGTRFLWTDIRGTLDSHDEKLEEFRKELGEVKVCVAKMSGEMTALKELLLERKHD